mgnify:CR=1 FL=1
MAANSAFNQWWGAMNQNRGGQQQPFDFGSFLRSMFGQRQAATGPYNPAFPYGQAQALPARPPTPSQPLPGTLQPHSLPGPTQSQLESGWQPGVGGSANVGPTNNSWLAQQGVTDAFGNARPGWSLAGNGLANRTPNFNPARVTRYAPGQNTGVGLTPRIVSQYRGPTFTNYNR